MRRALLVVAVIAAALARPAAACCQLGGTACGDPFAVDCNNGSVCFVPYRTCPSCTCTSTSGGHTCLPTTSEPGAVPTLYVDRSAGSATDLDLSWGASCRAPGPDYSVHEGELGFWYSHAPLRCATGGALSVTLTPTGGNRYYLIAPLSGDFTGSLGTNSAGAERPDGAPSCTADRALAPCP